LLTIFRNHCELITFGGSFRSWPDIDRLERGQWDSSLYAWSDPIHPRTVGVRIEIVDSRTRNPIPNVQVRLKGTYVEERIGALAEDALGLEQLDSSTPPRQNREFELSARTATDGVAVFALRWLKEYPWSLERPHVPAQPGTGGGTRGARSWFPPVDDIEKVQALEIRHPDYRGIDLSLDFDHLLKFGQKHHSELQSPEVFEQFERAWRGEIGRPGVVFFVLEPGDQFPDFGNKWSTRPEFFQSIRRQSFGRVYEEQQNLTALRPHLHAGPYFAYLLEIELEPARDEIVIIPRDDSAERRAAEERRRVEEERQARERERARSEAEERARRKAEEERRAAEERKRREEEARQRAERERLERERREREERLRAEANRNVIGVAVETVTSSRRQELGLPLGVSGVVVEYAKSGSPAASAGLRTDDVIESIDYRAVDGKSAFESSIKYRNKGDQFPIGIWRTRAGRRERQTVQMHID